MSQQRAQYTQYATNQFLLNPAIAGSQDMDEVKLGVEFSGLDLRMLLKRCSLAIMRLLKDAFSNDYE